MDSFGGQTVVCICPKAIQKVTRVPGMLHRCRLENCGESRRRKAVRNFRSQARIRGIPISAHIMTRPMTGGVKAAFWYATTWEKTLRSSHEDFEIHGISHLTIRLHFRAPIMIRTKVIEYSIHFLDHIMVGGIHGPLTGRDKTIFQLHPSPARFSMVVARGLLIATLQLYRNSIKAFGSLTIGFVERRFTIIQNGTVRI